MRAYVGRPACFGCPNVYLSASLCLCLCLCLYAPSIAARAGKTIAWVGDGNNVLHDLALGATALGACAAR
eukprot:26177-Eustigmatos_ZCMA.PRE.1